MLIFLLSWQHLCIFFLKLLKWNVKSFAWQGFKNLEIFFIFITRTLSHRYTWFSTNEYQIFTRLVNWKSVKFTLKINCENALMFSKFAIFWKVFHLLDSGFKCKFATRKYIIINHNSNDNNINFHKINNYCYFCYFLQFAKKVQVQDFG